MGSNFFTIVISLLLITAFVSADIHNPIETFYVDVANGNDQWDGTSAEYLGNNIGPKKTLDAGLMMPHQFGDIIQVADGSYVINQNTNLSNLLIKSANGPDNCTLIIIGNILTYDGIGMHGFDVGIDGFSISNDHGPAFTFNNFSIASIRNCMFTGNCRSNFDGIISCSGNSVPTISGCTFTNNIGYSFASAIYCSQDSRPVIIDCKIQGPYSNDDSSYGILATENSQVTVRGSIISGTWGGGILCNGNARLFAEDCEISNNFVEGGVILDEFSFAEMTNCLITKNISEQFGFAGGITCRGTSGLTLSKCTINKNWSAELAGGILVEFANLQPIKIDSCDITDNKSMQHGGGGIVAFEVGDFSLTNSLISGNLSFTDGAGVSIQHCMNGFISGCRFEDNETKNNVGGLSVSESDNVVVTECVFAGNIGRESAAMRSFQNTRAVISNCLFYDNESTGNNAVLDIDARYLEVINCTIANNIGGGVLVGTAITPMPEPGSIRNCIVWGNEGFQTSGMFGEASEYCNVQDGWFPEDNKGNIDVQPLFVDADNGDFHLVSTANGHGRFDPDLLEWVAATESSPCIDAGDPGDDASSEPLGNGGRINMGCYGGTGEASLTNVCAFRLGGDLNGDCIVNIVDFAVVARDWMSNTIIK